MPKKRLDPSSLIATSEACDLLGITRQTLYSWMKSGRLKPWTRITGTTWLFEKKEVERLRGTKYDRANGKRRVRG